MHVRWGYPPCIRRCSKECLPFTLHWCYDIYFRIFSDITNADQQVLMITSKAHVKCFLGKLETKNIILEDVLPGSA